ncbi:hypothetical protein AVEN_159513-1 [Araneus ventricosus]|uniref:Histone-lysine N-methyltransferase SETMAR n=1 Tax=Araneus ventricosus TaxID=182803 RepID=A0A4Y2A2A2_ARAVE|nr:hypothetical protein AVEN_159513-1 [Araneus ventricosus]
MRSKKSCLSRRYKSKNSSNFKLMVIITYGCDGVFLVHSVPQAQSANYQYYCSFEAYLSRKIAKKVRTTFAIPPIILHDDVHPHISQPVTDLCVRWSWGLHYHHS